MGTEAGTILTINNIDENVDLVDVDEGALGSNAFNQLNDIVVNLNRGDTYTLAVEASGGGAVPVHQLIQNTTQDTHIIQMV